MMIITASKSLARKSAAFDLSMTVSRNPVALGTFKKYAAAIDYLFPCGLCVRLAFEIKG